MAETPQKSTITLNHDLNNNYYDIHLQPPSTFNLEKSVCSHGLFLMAPNQWDPQTKSLLRPLRHSLSSTSTTAAAYSAVRIFSGECLVVRVYGVRSLAREAEEAIVSQVKRMLRLSEDEQRKVEEFQNLHFEAKEVEFGRVFRSPTLFEDMVKAILLCNCQWPRTLSMAKALCDLQLELQSQSSVNALGDAKSEVAANGRERFTPGTPAIKESQRKRKMQKVESGETVDAVNVTNADESSKINSAPLVNGIRDDEVDELNENSGEITTFGLSISDDKDEELNENSVVVSELRMMCSTEKMGNFPSPIEIASLDEIYLAKRCGLGYRSGRILKLAQGVVDGRIQLDQLEELCNEACLSNYNKVDEKLREIEGFGPFTRGNVMMCLGFYNVVPTDSETIRHLKQVHGTTTTIQKVQKVVEEMYKKYEPYQFLAYWWEIWSFYEGHFGKFSEMPSSDYKLITASNMRTKKTKKKPA